MEYVCRNGLLSIRFKYLIAVSALRPENASANIWYVELSQRYTAYELIIYRGRKTKENRFKY